MSGRSSRWQRGSSARSSNAATRRPRSEHSSLDGSYEESNAGIAAIELTHEEVRSLTDKIAPPDAGEPH